MIRPLRDEVERYGHYSLAAESMYDHPFQWGSKRNGPDLARVGGKYSDDWHADHLRDPRSVVPASIMPGYPFLEKTPLEYKRISEDLVALSRVGVPYSEDMIDHAVEDLRAQGAPDTPGAGAMRKRYANAIVRDLGVDKREITEADALIAYLQRLGTQIDFKLYDDKANIR
jgi:cytochrome c oxidase cbb3-type subunit II